MRKITVHLGERSYPILIGRGLLVRLGRFLKPLRTGSKVLVVSNRKVASYFFQTIRRSLVRSGFQVSLFLLPFGDERDKSDRVLVKLWQRMSQIGLDRTNTIVALGGGVVGDVSGFAASTYMRGIALVQVPTTLLAQVDSAIGGKTAIDLPSAKNMVGTFYQPRLVVCDVETLKGLGEKEFRNSFAEVVKYGVIRDSKLFALLEQKGPAFISDLERKSFGRTQLSFLEMIVWRSAQVKARVVEEDEQETKGKRMILNYGHTFAHALEAASKFRIQHGEAVARGMIFAGDLACRMGIFSEKDRQRQIDLIYKINVPKKYRFTGTQLLPFMKRDKKVRHGRLRFVLPTGIGQVKIFDDVPQKLLKQVLDSNRE